MTIPFRLGSRQPALARGRIGHCSARPAYQPCVAQRCANSLTLDKHGTRIFDVPHSIPSCDENMNMFSRSNLLALVLVALCGKPLLAGVAVFVTGPIGNPAGGGGAEFNFGSVTVDIDPSSTLWIAWNDAPTPTWTDPRDRASFSSGRMVSGLMTSSG